MEDRFLITLIGWFFLFLGWFLYFFYEKTKKENTRTIGSVCFIIALLLFIFNILYNIF